MVQVPLFFLDHATLFAVAFRVPVVQVVFCQSMTAFALKILRLARMPVLPLWLTISALHMLFVTTALAAIAFFVVYVQIIAGKCMSVNTNVNVALVASRLPMIQRKLDFFLTFGTQQTI